MKKNILVTAVGGRSVGSGILHALTRTSPDVVARWNVVAADAESFAWGLYKTGQRVLLPLANAENYERELERIIHEFRIDAVIPGSEPEVFRLAPVTDRFPVPVITNRAGLMPLMQDKYQASQKLRELELPVIPTIPIEEYKTLLGDFDFPWVIKPTRGTGGSRGLKLVVSEQEVQDVLNELPENSGVCVQPYIGSDDSEYTVGVLTDSKGKLIDSIVMKRKLIGLSLLDTKVVKGVRHSISTGYSQGYFIEDKKISSFCEDLALQLNSCGPLNIQLRVHGDRIYVFEIHPRFSGTSTMRADVGFNEPDVLLRNVLFGEEFSRLDYTNNVAVIRAFEHVVVPIDQML